MSEKQEEEYNGFWKKFGCVLLIAVGLVLLFCLGYIIFFFISIFLRR
ncbi:hypothetical protein ACG2LH_12790 [Zhouia sp. PK063]